MIVYTNTELISPVHRPKENKKREIAMTEVDHLLAKKVADRYLKREVLGEGTYGVVFKAIDTKVFLSYTAPYICYCCI